MSNRHGAGTTRSRPQKHKNTFAFKNDLHDKTPQQKKINTLNVCEVCERCKSQIEWRIKYKKYKPLSQPKTCARCGNRTVKKAYHVVCHDCARRDRVCAKCLTSADKVTIEPPGPTPAEEQHLKVEMDRLIKSLPERKRRTFLRYMKKGKEIDENAENGSEKKGDTENADGEDEKEKKRNFVPHNREELLNKIEALKLADGDEDGDDSDFSFDDSDLDDKEEEMGSDSEDE